jgi:eukaryotic-like serine/threonine-protein kinase
MGAVYEVLHVETRRRRALKVMLPSVVSDADARERFRREATVAAEIESEHIVEVFDAGVDDETGTPFIVMELLRGEELAETVARKGRLAPEQVVTYLAQVAAALDKTHAAGVVHRDLKPENLFLTTRDDGSPRVKVLDFGIAKVVAQSAAVTRTVGTPLYMAPEQIRGDPIGPAVDRYALTQIAYTLLVGEAYWTVEHTAAQGVYAFLMRVVEGIKEPPRERARARGIDLPPQFDAWFARGTAADPKQRFSSGSALVIALADAFDVAAPLPADALLELPSSMNWRTSSPDLRFQLGGAASDITGSGPTHPADGATPVGSASGAGTISATEIGKDALRTRGSRSRGVLIGVGVALTLGAVGVAIAITGAGQSTPSAEVSGEDPRAVAAPSKTDLAVTPVVTADPVVDNEVAASASPDPDAASPGPQAEQPARNRPQPASPRTLPPREKSGPSEEPKKLPASGTGARDPLDVR